MMKLEECERLLLTFGSDLERWPEDVRESARALLSQSEDARALLADMQNMDRVLATLDREDMPPGLAERIVAAAEMPGGGSGLRDQFLKLAISAAASLVVGISLGLSGLGQSTAGTGEGGIDAVSVAFGLTDSLTDGLGTDSLDDEEH